ncbi:uncharacterized protein BJ212DRAFT_1443614 [Suillus subaureus]|uniref:DUF7702 domain-containing protein n=1 Tax=Suillus subaureus TaxID=48587 RepID=A0A9P7EML9_9AGAM|nr:uncharacterized protein BJ212DRAFT_1443614 [Suillus subaureus]KAG1825484.1 hypothetical protein BJ212DRAFT_1443614 [Suillus subaureus]
MTLDSHGVLAAVTIAMYVPFLLVSLKIVSKYGMARGDGWVLLLVFCFIRVLGGALLVAAEEVTPVNTSLYIGGYALEASGLSPLLLCTLGLLHSIFQTPDGFPRYQRQFRLLQLLGMVALILTIIGISDETSSSSGSSSSGNTMRRAGVILFAALYIILVGICLHQWTQIRSVMRYRKQLLKAISVALPFLAIRTIYSILSTFSSSTFSVTSTSSTQANTSDLAKFNLFTGEWQIYLVMDMLMEYAVVIIYSVAALMLPLNNDYKSPDSYQDQYPLSGPQY